MEERFTANVKKTQGQATISINLMTIDILKLGKLKKGGGAK